MEHLKAVLKKLFFLPPLPTVLIAVPSFIFVFVMLGTGDHSVFSYLAYILSAYALVITVTGISGVIEATRNGIEELPLIKRVRSTSLGNRLLGDAVFRSEVSLYGGLFVNLLYVALNLFSGTGIVLRGLSRLRFTTLYCRLCAQYLSDTSAADR